MISLRAMADLGLHHHFGYNSVYAGGPGSGCHGPNCGRPGGGGERRSTERRGSGERRGDAERGTRLKERLADLAEQRDVRHAVESDFLDALENKISPRALEKRSDYLIQKYGITDKEYGKLWRKMEKKHYGNKRFIPGTRKINSLL